MKRRFSWQRLFAGLSIFIAVFAMSCPKKAPEQAFGHAPEAEVSPSPGSTCPVSPGLFWTVHIERMGILKGSLEKQLEIYEQYGCDSPETEEKIDAIKEGQKQQMQSMWGKYDTSPRCLYPDGSDSEKLKEERQRYLTDHPELMKKIREDSQKINAIHGRINKLCHKG